MTKIRNLSVVALALAVWTIGTIDGNSSTGPRMNMQIVEQSAVPLKAVKSEQEYYAGRACTHIVQTPTVTGVMHFSCLRLYEGELR